MWAAEGKTERASEKRGIENPFIRFFALSLFLRNDDLSPLDLLFLTQCMRNLCLCTCVCVCLCACVCESACLCPLRDIRPLKAAVLNEMKLLDYACLAHAHAPTHTHTHQKFIRSSCLNLPDKTALFMSTHKVLDLEPNGNKRRG